MTTAPKSILITGCSSGIGLCVAQGLQQRGYRVIASARKAADVARLTELGLPSVQLDLDDTDSIQHAVAAAVEIGAGSIYALFNNGAYGQPGAVEDLSRDALRQQFETNVFGWHQLTNAVLPIMRQQRSGRIIQNSSILGFIAIKYRGAYTASKYAIEGLSDTLRLELADSGIFVSLIEPGPISSQFRDNAYQKYREHINTETSPHRQTYVKWERRFIDSKAEAAFTLPPSAVLKKVVHALESRRPKSHYRVTVPTHLFAVLKRTLPVTTLDWLLGKLT